MEQNGKQQFIDKEQSRRLSWLEEHYSKFNNEMGTVQADIKWLKENTASKDDVKWLKRFFWIIATASIGGAIGTIVTLIKLQMHL